MGGRFHGRNGHKSIASHLDYQLRDHERMGFGSELRYRCGDGRSFSPCSRHQAVLIGTGVGLNGERLRRPHPRAKEGEAFSLDLPFTAVQAMKEKGLLDDPKPIFLLLDRHANRAMQRLNDFAYGRTTNGRRVKIDLLYFTTYGSHTRAGYASPEVCNWVLNVGAAADTKVGKGYAIDWRRLYQGQREAAAVFEMGVAHDLARFRIMCVPSGRSFRVLGFDHTVKPARTQEMESWLKQTGYAGPDARARAARATRQPKRDVPWAEALKNVAVRVKGKVERVVKVLSEVQQERFAERSFRLVAADCRRNVPTFTRTDLFTAYAYTVLPHVSPEVATRVFDWCLARGARYGLAEVKRYQDGNVLYAAANQSAVQRRAARAVAAGTTRTAKGLALAQVVRGLAGKGYSQAEFRAVEAMAKGASSVTINHRGLDPKGKLMRALIEAYAANNRDVILAGPGYGRGLRSVADRHTRVTHPAALWRGARTPGTFQHKLWVAEQVRRHGHTPIKRGSLVVLRVGERDGLRDAASVTRIVKAAKRAKAQVLITGPGAKHYEALVSRYRQEQAQRPHARTHQRGYRP